MEIELPDGRKATLIGQVTDVMSKIRLEDGRETLWPTAKIKQLQKEGEDTLKLVVIPAMQRLQELEQDYQRLNYDVNTNNELDEKYFKLRDELVKEARQEFLIKWGLI